MTDLRPLLEVSESSHACELLKAGRADAPADGFSDRLLAGLGVAGAVSSVTVTASAGTAGAAVHGAAATGTGAMSLGLVAAKWVAVGMLGGGILAGGTDLLLSRLAPPEVARTAPQRSGSESRAQPTLAIEPHEAVAAEAVEPLPSATLRQADAKPRSSVASAGSAAAASVEQGQLGREVQAIDRARRARAAGNLMQALSELDAFEQVSRTGVLDREARVLRIETLFEIGQPKRASELADQYLQAFPNDAHAGRLRALLKLEEEK